MPQVSAASPVLVDSCVLIDVIENDARWAEWSTEQLQVCSEAAGVAINLVIYAEIAKSFATLHALNSFVDHTGLEVRAVSREAAFRAANAHLAYRRNKGSLTTTLPDFFIGAQAAVEGLRILTRDKKRFARYFPEVKLITP